MGLIADIVESIKFAIGKVEPALQWRGEQNREALTEMGDAVLDAMNQVTFGMTSPDVESLKAEWSNTFRLSALAFSHPDKFIEELFSKWSDKLMGAYGKLNVEVSDDAMARGGDAVAAQLLKLDLGSDASKDRITAALITINAIVVGGNAAAIVAEASSLGIIRSVGEAIQSFIWANGLGSFSPLAFTPQMQASLNPYLTRHYNARATAQLPPVTDIIRFQLREVFLEGRREELVGDEERPVFDQAMKEWGFDKFCADSYWGAHWQLQSITQLNEMLFRGVISRETWGNYVRFNDFVPAQIDNLARISYSPFTRVDSRRMYRLGVLTDQELLQSYADVGYYADTEESADGSYKARFTGSSDYSTYKAEALVLFTKIFNQVPELRQRYSKGWISAEEVLAELLATGIPPERAEALYQTIVKNDAEARVAPERELTRGLIARAWKLREISFPQATYLLTRIGWSVPEAELILRVQSQPDDPLAMVSTNLGIRLGATIGEAVEPSEFLEL